MISLKIFMAMFVIGGLGVACSPAVDATTPGGTTPASLVGTWVNFHYGSNTNTYIFGADGSYKEIGWGPSYGAVTNTNSGTYTYASPVLTLNQVLNGSFTNLQTKKNLALLDGGYFYYGQGNIFQLQSGVGWSGVYKTFSSTSWVDNGTNISFTNFMLLTSTPSNITVTAGTNAAITNGVATYSYESSAPPAGTVLSWTNTSSDDWHSFDMGGIQYFLKIANFLVISSTNVRALCGQQYIKQ
jgi:hypothetical protein